MDSQVVIVAVDASKEITDYAIEWAVKNVCKATDFLVVLAVLPSAGSPSTTANRTNNFLSCFFNIWRLENQQKVKNPSDHKVAPHDVSRRIHKVCVQMIRQLCLEHNKQVHSEVKVVADAQLGSVGTEAKELEATWVVLDRRLKREADCCKNKLDCNIVLVDHDIPKVLKAIGPLARKHFFASVEQEDSDMLGLLPAARSYNYETATTRSILGLDSPFSDTDPSVLMSNTEKEQSKMSSTYTKPNSVFHLNSAYFWQALDAEAEFRLSSYSKSQLPNVPLALQMNDSPQKSLTSSLDGRVRRHENLALAKIDLEGLNRAKDPESATLLTRSSTSSPHLGRKQESKNKSSHIVSRKQSCSGHEEDTLPSPSSPSIQRTSSIRKAMSLSMKHPPTLPPLCSICKHNAPVFGKTPKKFSYKEIVIATDGFSKENPLAEGGYGSVYRGVLPDGQLVAVKRHRTLNAQGASKFCAEVEVLSCAQHRNLVMLVGYCIEKEWLLVYEFACNGSLDKHLYKTEKGNEVMSWNNRMKVAVGAARGLRYLHEDCRVGCIVHRDFRPKNILLTHDFESMVGDFGLARWQAHGQSAEETRVVGAFGYLAPEYTQTGLITEKADVYAFGVVLLELLSGIKSTDFSRRKGQQFVLEWARPLLERNVINEILDPRMDGDYEDKEVECMMYAARLCTSLKPENRPRMSKVLKILEGDVPSASPCSLGQYISTYPKIYSNNTYDSNSSKISVLDYKPSTVRSAFDQSSYHKMQSMHLMKESPPVTNVHKIGYRSSMAKSLTHYSDSKLVNGVWDNNQNDLDFSGDYQAYLQGSLAKFIHNFKQLE